MKRVLITGEHGYVATSLKSFLDKQAEDYDVRLLSLRGNWEDVSFANVDVIIHTVALVHKNEKNHDMAEYNKINVTLTSELAKKAKKEGVSQFIFISTEAVYGLTPSCFKTIVIDKDTCLNPCTKYGITKLAAENCLREIETNDFLVNIVRPPMIYGPNCTGNYKLLRKLTLEIGFAPKMQAQKSFIYIDNLCNLFLDLIQHPRKGLFCPQNKEVVGTYEMMKLIGKYNNKNVVFLSILNPLVKIASLMISTFSKAFGSLVYSQELSNIDGCDYSYVSFDKSIQITESNGKRA